METFLWTLAAAAVVGLAGLALKSPYVLVRLATAIWPFLGMAGAFGAGTAFGGNPKLGFWIAAANLGAMVYVILLGHLAVLGLNARADQGADSERREQRDP